MLARRARRARAISRRTTATARCGLGAAPARRALAIALVLRRRGRWVAAGIFAFALRRSRGPSSSARSGSWFGWLRRRRALAFGGFDLHALLARAPRARRRVATARASASRCSRSIAGCRLVLRHRSDLGRRQLVGGRDALIGLVYLFVAAASTAPAQPYGFWLHLVGGPPHRRRAPLLVALERGRLGAPCDRRASSSSRSPGVTWRSSWAVLGSARVLRRSDALGRSSGSPAAASRSSRPTATGCRWWSSRSSASSSSCSGSVSTGGAVAASRPRRCLRSSRLYNPRGGTAAAHRRLGRTGQFPRARGRSAAPRRGAGRGAPARAARRPRRPDHPRAASRPRSRG